QRAAPRAEIARGRILHRRFTEPRERQGTIPGAFGPRGRQARRRCPAGAPGRRRREERRSGHTVARQRVESALRCRGNGGKERGARCKMVTLDYIVLAVVLVSAIVGAFRGFLREVFSVISWILAIWLAWKYAPVLAPKLGGPLKNPEYGQW